MAASLIDTMTEDFDPDQYHDAYREALEAVVRAKVEGNEIVRPAGVVAPPKSQPADLTEILRASVAALKSERGQPGAADDSATTDGPAKSRTRAKTRAAGQDGKAAKEEADAKPATRRKASA
jgi:DNA end-binding protein Ku